MSEPSTGRESGEVYYIENGWSGCAGSAWNRLPPAAKDGWAHAERLAAGVRLRMAAAGADGAEGWASYAAEQERHAETARARDEHYAARNRLATKVDRLEERLAGAMEVAATIDDARARVVKAARATVVSDAMKGIRTHNDQPLSPANLRWAATHEALCRSFVFDVLMGLADALEREDEK